ncbi:MAG: hypothetical protein JXA30_18560 [Deltaproteobacteria bacterium]|nr:hypothetical protein [Deltaproteobacteria bacterium]
MTIRKAVATTAALLLLLLNTVSAQDDFDSEDLEESDDEYEDDESPEEQPRAQESFPTQARDDEGYFEPKKKADAEDEVEAAEDEEAVPGKSHKEYKPIGVGLLAGYGFSFGDDINALGFGFGLRGGYTFEMDVYAGLKFIYNLGTETNNETANFVTIGVEGGYKLELDPVVFMPSIELGIALYSYEDSTPGRFAPKKSSEDFYFAPALSVLYPIDMFFVGADIAVYVVFLDPAFAGLSLMATFGVDFAI